MILSKQRKYSVIAAPSILGLKPTGVELLPKALRQEGLVERLNAEYYGMVTPLSPYSYRRDKETKLLNAETIKDYSLRLADTVNSLLHENKFPIVI